MIEIPNPCYNHFKESSCKDIWKLIATVSIGYFSCLANSHLDTITQHQNYFPEKGTWIIKYLPLEFQDLGHSRQWFWYFLQQTQKVKDELKVTAIMRSNPRWRSAVWWWRFNEQGYIWHPNSYLVNISEVMKFFCFAHYRFHCLQSYHIYFPPEWHGGFHSKSYRKAVKNCWQRGWTSVLNSWDEQNAERGLITQKEWLILIQCLQKVFTPLWLFHI